MVFGYGKEKELPKDPEIFRQHPHIGLTRSGEMQWHLPKKPWRNYVQQRIKEDSTSSKTKQLLNKSTEEIIAEVMPTGSIDLGNGCKIIKCHEKSKGVCAITQLDGKPVCSGPVYKKHRKFLPDKTSTTYPPSGCPYNMERLERYGTGDIPVEIKMRTAKEIVKVLKRHPDYEEIDMREKYEES